MVFCATKTGRWCTMVCGRTGVKFYNLLRFGSSFLWYQQPVLKVLFCIAPCKRKKFKK
jgi:hypothetical protein